MPGLWVLALAAGYAFWLFVSCTESAKLGRGWTWEEGRKPRGSLSPWLPAIPARWDGESAVDPGTESAVDTVIDLRRYKHNSTRNHQKLAWRCVSAGPASQTLAPHSHNVRHQIREYRNKSARGIIPWESSSQNRGDSTCSMAWSPD